MSNHYHLALHVDKSRAQSWSRSEVVERWMQLNKGDMLVSRWLKVLAALDEAQRDAVYLKSKPGANACSILTGLCVEATKLSRVWLMQTKTAKAVLGKADIKVRRCWTRPLYSVV